MSSILKALRKVEEEKRVAAHAAPDLRSDQGARARNKKTFGSLLTGMLLGAVCVGLVMYAIPGEDVTEPLPVDVQEENPVASQPKPTPTSAKKAVIETIPVVVMPPEPVSVETRAPRTNEPAAASPKETTAKSLTETQSVKVPGKPKPIAVAAPAESAIPSLPAGVTLQVTEIFYQPDPADRMAVVNDLPVMVGTPVDDALVSEIHPDYVLFKIDGNDYPVFLPAE